MEILQLRYFYETAKNESFSKTAEKFNVPPTSVSASVKRLEKELGCTLFHRTCNRILLNEKGKRLLQSLNVVFGELELAVKDLSPDAPDLREIKILVRTGRSTITQAIIAYKEKHPDVSFRTIFDFSENNFDAYDIIIDDNGNVYPNHESFPLYETVLCIRAAANSPLRGQRLTLSQLKDQPFISTGTQNSLHPILIEHCKHAGFVPNIVIECNDINCYLQYIIAGVCIGPARIFPDNIENNKLCTLNVTDFNEKRIVDCYYKTESDYGNVRDFLNFIKDYAKNSHHPS